MLKAFCPVRTLAVFGVLCLPAPSIAGTCPVPSAGHDTIQEAIDDLACATITLGAASYPEFIHIPRSLTLSGTGSATTTIDGPMEIVGVATQVNLVALAIRNGCPSIGLHIHSDARVVTSDVNIEPAAIPCPSLVPIFEDDFESGDLSGWSSSQPLTQSCGPKETAAADSGRCRGGRMKYGDHGQTLTRRYGGKSER